MEIVTISMNEDLYQKAMEACGDNGIMVFPTRIAASQAQDRYLQSQDLQDRLFLSMEDFEDSTILPDTAVLTDEKRLLCLYSVMSEEDREFFHILSYGDIVDWGGRFLDLATEMCEECLVTEQLEEMQGDGRIHLQGWQEIYLERILRIRQNYYDYISALGYTDRIFYLDAKHFCIPWQDRQIAFVNQYYYSALDKALLKELETKGNRVTVIYQGLEVKRSGDDWQVREFDLKEAWDSLEKKPKLEIIECKNEDQMALGVLEWNYMAARGDACSSNGSYGGVIIDSHFYQKNYSRYFNPQQFRKPRNYSITTTALYQMLVAIAEGINALRANRGYLPLSLLTKQFSTPYFLAYFVPKIDDLGHKEICRQLQKLVNSDYLYVDEKYVFSMETGSLKQVLQGFMGLLRSFGKVDSIAAMCDILDSTDDLQIKRLVDPIELEYTSLLESFWERVANFEAIEQLGLISDWTMLFPASERGSGILELFLDFLKTVKVAYQPKQVAQPQWEISNLLDARNRNFSQVVFLQMIEGVMPSNPSPVWLFSETQRKRLGLKSYSDIRAWERYYFFRLLLSAQQAVCFSYKNMERDINPSSFLGELQQVLKESGYQLTLQKYERQVKPQYEERFGIVNGQNAIQHKNEAQAPLDAGFFILPSEPDKDFGEYHAFSQSASGLLQFLRNPFVWYIETKSRLGTTPYEAEEVVSGKLFGNILHAFFAQILGQQRGRHTGTARLEELLVDRKALRERLVKLLSEGDFQYQIPKNYNREFLAEIISERLSESLAKFYHTWLKEKLANKSFTLIPESDEMTKDEKLYRSLGKVLHEGREFPIILRGKADLRIETDNEAMIIDFKTGSKDTRQLIIYEWIYYLLDGNWQEDAIVSTFWNILEAEPGKDKVTPDRRNKLREGILDTLADCLDSGYKQGSKTTDRQRLKSITRADLFIPRKEDNHA